MQPATIKNPIPTEVQNLRIENERLRIENEHLRAQNTGLRTENTRLRREHTEVRRTLDAHLARASSTALFGPIELTAGTCVSPRRPTA